MSRLSFLVLVFVSVWCAPALADSPLLPIQGRLLDSAGDAIDGNRTVSFAIYGTSTGGSPVYTESQEIGFTGGNFVAYLGDVVTLDPSLFDDAPPLWLGITIQGDSEMEPRIRLGSAPTAAFSHMCGDAATLGGLAASDFAPKVHSHVAWVDANGVEVAEALPWALRGTSQTRSHSWFGTMPTRSGCWMCIQATFNQFARPHSLVHDAWL